MSPLALRDAFVWCGAKVLLREGPCGVDDAEMTGLVDGRYAIVREVARGGMCTVQAADHVHTARRVALKRLAPEVDASLDKRLLLEAWALEQCRGPHVVDVLDAGVDGRAYVVLELLEGKGLDALLTTRKRLPRDAALAVFAQLCAALETVHAKGIVHRDIKPANLFVAHQGRGERLKLLDFGVARVPSAPDVRALTQVGERLGTLEYMAPEQVLAETADASSDLYAAAVVLFESLAGEVPYKGGPRELLQALATRAAPPRLSSLAPGVPAALDEVMQRALAHDKEARFGSAAALAAAVRGAMGNPGTATFALLDAPRPVDASYGRGHERAPYVTPVRVLVEGTTFDGHAADISEGGLLVMLANPPPEGRPTEVRFCLPVSGRVVTVAAEVRWRKEARVQRAVGLRFTELTDEIRADIRRFVSIAGTS
jgi:uncharacterized protein (TIGR02266 family)